jgi:hypothetical protein
VVEVVVHSLAGAVARRRPIACQRLILGATGGLAQQRLELGNSCSIGLRSGLYGGRYQGAGRGDRAMVLAFQTENRW